MEKQISPDGTNQAIAYSKNVSDIFPDSDFTIKHTGSYESTMSYSYASFDSMNWSADSKYLVVSMVEEDNTYLKVFDYLYHTEVNLNWYLDRAIYQSTGLFEFPYDEDANSKIKYRFLQWSEYKNTMLLYFTFLDKKGIERSGYFWYDYENGSISGISELFVQETADVEKEIGICNNGEIFYVMNLVELDVNGSVQEFIFSIVDSTQLRWAEKINKCDKVSSIKG